MQAERIDTIIIGGGLSGIYAANLLSQKNQSFILLEARNRIGGRILSPDHQGYASDLGPSWYWPDIHPEMANLIKILNLKGFQQYEEGYGRFQSVNSGVQTVKGYPADPVSWRLSGGMMALITKLYEAIPQNKIKLNCPVCQIESKDGKVLVSVGELENEPWPQFIAKNVILAIPPRLAATTILFTPDFSHSLAQSMLKIGTWMAGQAKFYALYDNPFWRQSGLSGQAFSQIGPLGEIHDGSNDKHGPYGLTGFVGIPAVQRKQAHPGDAILSQLALIFGAPASQPTAFFYQDWAQERFTATEYDQPPMVEHPFYHPPEGKTSIWNQTLLFAGTETADQHGGYLEGALTSATRAVKQLYAELN